MSGDSSPLRYDRLTKLLGSGLIGLLVGVAAGTFLVAPVLPRAESTPRLAEVSALSFGRTVNQYVASAFGSEPTYTLRLVQSIGILLPLFTGLLRFTTDEKSNVDETMNTYLLLGILSLVVSGTTATLGGVLTDVAGILKASLLFVFAAFVVIGIAAIVMFDELPESTDEHDDSRTTMEPKRSDEENQRTETETEQGDTTDGNDAEMETEPEPDSGPKGERDRVDRELPESESEPPTNVE